MQPCTELEYRAYQQWARNNVIAISITALSLLALFLADVFSAIAQLNRM